MKLNPTAGVFALAALLISCDHDEPRPDKTGVVMPLRLELDDFKREFVLDSDNRVWKVKNSSFMPGDVTLESTIEYVYTQDGKYEKSLMEGGYRLEYHYEGDKIIRTDRYSNDVLSQYYTFSYDAEGRIDEVNTWQDIPEEGGLIPKMKDLYVYDASDNMTFHLLYYYDSGINGHVLLTSFEYGDYDNQVEAESLFDGYTTNPLAKFRKNNPGKMVLKNKHGNTTMIDQYSYVYDSRGYATRKTTTSIIPYNGSGGSYDTQYYYTVR